MDNIICCANCNQGFVNIATLITAIIAIIVSFKAFIINKKTLKADIITRYNERFYNDSSMQKMIALLDDKERERKEFSVKELKDTETAREMFIRHCEELEYLIETKTLDAEIVYYMFGHYPLKLNEMNNLWNNLEPESPLWWRYHKFISRMKKEKDRIEKKKAIMQCKKL